MPTTDIFVMTTITPREGHTAAAIAGLGDLLSWETQQPGFVRADVLADPEHDGVFWIAERWASRDLRDAALLDPAGASRLAKVEALLGKDDVAAYVSVDLYPHGRAGEGDALAAITRSAGGPPLSPRPASDAPTVQIARFHLRPGTYDRFIAAERRQDDALDGVGVIALEIARHSDNPNRLCHYEVWPTSEAHRAYVDSYERQRFVADAATLLVEPEPSEELGLIARYVPEHGLQSIPAAPLVPPVDRAALSPEAREAIEAAPPRGHRQW